MKKTSTIHLSGLLFNIEEDAYEKFSQYIQSVEKYFENHAGKKEILEDIENQIAEILSGKINDHKKVITMEDVQSLIQTMGHPDEFWESSEKLWQKTSANLLKILPNNFSIFRAILSYYSFKILFNTFYPLE